MSIISEYYCFVILARAFISNKVTKNDEVLLVRNLQLVSIGGPRYSSDAGVEGEPGKGFPRCLGRRNVANLYQEGKIGPKNITGWRTRYTTTL